MSESEAMTPRCIVLVGYRRCHRPAAKRMGNLYACCSHGRITLAIMSNWLSAHSRRRLAYARWESPREGQRLLHQKAAAA